MPRSPSRRGDSTGAGGRLRLSAFFLLGFIKLHGVTRPRTGRAEV